MAKEPTVIIVNTKDRSFNGIRQFEQANIPESEVSEYLSNGFEIVADKKAQVKPEAKAPEASPKFDRKGAIDKLTAAGIQFKEVGTSNDELKALLAQIPEAPTTPTTLEGESGEAGTTNTEESEAK